jgi:hypothetical protein
MSASLLDPTRPERPISERVREHVGSQEAMPFVLTLWGEHARVVAYVYARSQVAAERFLLNAADAVQARLVGPSIDLRWVRAELGERWRRA